jgi:hypothetical protein
MRRSTTRTTKRERPIQLGGTQLAVVCATLLGLCAVAAAMFWPTWYDFYATVAVKRFERGYGFETGAVEVRMHGETVEMWGIVSVTSGGQFQRWGFRAGDIPVAHHGGKVPFHQALSDVERGVPAVVDVLNTVEWAGGFDPRRIHLTPPH